MAAETPNIYPFMRFADANAALEWLSRAFGFDENVVYRNGNVIQHAEVALGPGIVMLGQGDPKDPTSQGVYVAVEDVDAHYERAKAAGAEIIREIEDTDYESREYTARDPEGHVWSFGTYHPTVS
ncbi:MAG: VOC family protein [Actinomycetota bacterium]|nr:VOC family protein [Actinomycetota bacterium]